MLNNLPKWDRIDHIQNLVDVLETRQDKKEIKNLLKDWLVAAYNTAIENSRYVNGRCIVLAGPQGCGKTTFLKTIASIGNSYSGHINTQDDKHIHDIITRKFIVNIDDQLDIRSDYNSLKKLIKLTDITNRTCSFVGTCHSFYLLMPNPENMDAILIDDTFIILRLKSIDLEALKAIDIDQLWAQAKEYSSYPF